MPGPKRRAAGGTAALVVLLAMTALMGCRAEENAAPSERFATDITISSLSYDATGEVLAIASLSLHLHDHAGTRQIPLSRGIDASGVAIAPSGELFVCGNGADGVLVFDLKGGTPEPADLIALEKGPPGYHTLSLGTSCLAASYLHAVVIDLESRAVIWRLENAIEAVISGDDRFIAYFQSNERTLSVAMADITSRLSLGSIVTPSEPRTLAFAGPVPILCIGCEDGSVRLHRISSSGAQDAGHLKIGRHPITALHASQNGLVAAGDSKGVGTVWSIEERRRLLRASLGHQRVTAVTIAKDASECAAGYDDGKVGLWRIPQSQ